MIKAKLTDNIFSALLFAAVITAALLSVWFAASAKVYAAADSGPAIYMEEYQDTNGAGVDYLTGVPDTARTDMETATGNEIIISAPDEFYTAISGAVNAVGEKAPVKISMLEQGTNRNIGGGPFFTTAAIDNPYTYLAPHVAGYSLVGSNIGRVANVEADYSSEITFIYAKTTSNVSIICKEQNTNNIIRVYEIANPAGTNTATGFEAPDLSPDFYTLISDQNLTYAYDGVNATEKTLYYTKDEATIWVRALDDATKTLIGARQPLAHLRKGEVTEVYAPAIMNYMLLDPSPIMMAAYDGEVDFLYASLSDSGVAVKIYAGGIAEGALLQEYIIPAESGGTVTVNPAAIQIPGFVFDGANAGNKLSATVGDASDIIVIMSDVRMTIAVKTDVDGVQTPLPVEKIASGGSVTLYPPYMQGYAAAMYSLNGGGQVAIPEGFSGYKTTVTANFEIVWFYEAIGAPVQPETGSLTITVTVASTGAPQPGATVKLPATGDKVYTADNSGRVVISNLAFGLYTATASYGDFNVSVATVSLTANNANQTVVLTLAKDTGGAATPTTGSLAITVTNASTGTPQSGATVKVFNSSRDYTYTSDSAGKVSVSNLPFGTYTVTAAYSDYNLGIASVTLSADSAGQTVILGLNRDTDGGAQATSGSLTVYVTVASTGQYQSGVSVRVYGAGKDSTYTTDSTGKVSITGLNFGIYTATAVYTGYNTGVSTVTLSSGNANQSVTIALGKETAAVNDTTAGATGSSTSTSASSDSYTPIYDLSAYLSQYSDEMPASGMDSGLGSYGNAGQYDASIYGDTRLPSYETGFANGYAPLVGFIGDHIKFINGYLDGTLRPDADITRAEAAAIIFRLLAAEEKDNPLPQRFTDIDMSEWYAQPITYLAKMGGITGYYDDSYKPDEPITRAEFITIISRFDNTPDQSAVMFFDTVGHWAEDYINNAAQKGWITGYLDGSFQPDANMTRAELVTVINRIFYRGVESYDIPDWAPSFSDLPNTHWAYNIMLEAAIGHDYVRKDNGYEIWIYQN